MIRIDKQLTFPEVPDVTVWQDGRGALRRRSTPCRRVHGSGFRTAGRS